MSAADHEILEVVDAEDKPIAAAARSEIHQKGLLHRAVHVFVFNSAGEIYLQRRSASKDRFPDLLDSSAAGHVNPGEPYADAARRELLEELGVQCDLVEALRVPACELMDNEHVVLYTATTDATPTPDPEEIQWGGFVGQQELTRLMTQMADDFVPGFIYLWQEYLRKPH
jgi:isopentenyl-diphosphate delta-isomerase type 1